MKTLKNPATLNLILILLLVIARCMAAGWMIILTGLLLFFPALIFHAIVSTIAFSKYALFSARVKVLLWLGVLSVITFTLFQLDMDDIGSYSVMSVIMSLISAKSRYLPDKLDTSMYVLITEISALVLIVADILLIIKLILLKKKNVRTAIQTDEQGKL